MLIDTHFHLDLMDNMQSLIREFRAADVGVIAVGTTPKAYEREKQFCSENKNIKVGLGLHPQLIAERGQEIEELLDMVKRSKYIGEIGLDFNNGYIASKEKQISCFREIAKACANEGGKILSVHSVKAAGTVIDELSDAGVFRNNICIFHWFTGSASERRRAIEIGAWFSVNLQMLRTKKGQETIKEIPANRILLETDAPFTMKVSSIKVLKDTLQKLIEGISNIRQEDVRSDIENNMSMIWNFCL